MQAGGYRIFSYYLWLREPELAVSRVAPRVNQGGHDILEETVRRRSAKGLTLFLRLYLSLTDACYVYDNSNLSLPQLIAYQPLEGNFRSFMPKLGTHFAEKPMMSDILPASEIKTAGLPSPRLEDVDRDMRNGIANALREHAAAGRLVPILRDGKVVHVSPQEILNSKAETVSSEE